jgi:hypothetical protein
MSQLAQVGIPAMSLWTACVWAFFRSLAIVLLGLPICVQLQKGLSRATGWQRSLAWSILLLPLVAPQLVTGYGFANFSLSLIHHPVWNEVLYDVLILIGSVPAGVVLLYFTPPAPVSSEAVHCARLLTARTTIDQRASNMTWNQWLGIWMRGPARNLVPAAALLFLIAFQEFEMASMMLVPTWTVWLFDAQTGGLLVSKALQYAALPLSFEVFLLGSAALLYWQTRHLTSRPGRPPSSPGALNWLWCYLACASGLYCFIPWSLVLGDSWPGYSALLRNRTLPGDILRGLMMALVAGTAVYLVAYWLQTSKSQTRLRKMLVPLSLVAAITGLMGALSVSLVTLFIFQLPIVYRVYDTPLPWFCGLAWFLAPRAAVVVSVLIVLQRQEPKFLAKILSRSSHVHQRTAGRQLQWEMQGMRHFWGIVLICYWAFLDGTVAALLAPVAWTSSPVRLYNLMHYGQSSVLSAMVVVTFGVPLICVALFLCIRRPLARYLQR